MENGPRFFNVMTLEPVSSEPISCLAAKEFTMKRYIMSLAALVGLSGAILLCSPVQAGPPGHPGPGKVVHPGHSGPGKIVHPGRPGPIRIVHPGRTEVTFYRHHGFDRCLYREYHSWSRYFWSPRYRCYFYFSPEANDYYYWYAPSGIYLPISALATLPPTVVVNVGPRSL